MTKMDSKFNIEDIGDIFTPRELIQAGYPGGKGAVYSLFHREGFPVIKHGKKFLVSKKAFIDWLDKQVQA